MKCRRLSTLDFCPQSHANPVYIQLHSSYVVKIPCGACDAFQSEGTQQFTACLKNNICKPYLLHITIIELQIRVGRSFPHDDDDRTTPAEPTTPSINSHTLLTSLHQQAIILLLSPLSQQHATIAGLIATPPRRPVQEINAPIIPKHKVSDGSNEASDESERADASNETSARARRRRRRYGGWDGGWRGGWRGHVVVVCCWWGR